MEGNFMSGLVQKSMDLINLLNNQLSVVLLFVLLGSGFFYTLRTRFIQFNFKNMWSAFQEGFTDSDNTSKKISPFEAFAVTTASRVGTGNLAGVALALTLGGPGAIFWMWLTALLGGSLAFVESTLAQVYKTKDDSQAVASHFIGGPAYYIQKGLGSKGLGNIFAILLVFVFGLSFNAVQANTISQAVSNNFNIPVLFSAVILSVITALFVFKGLRSIAKASTIIVPIMAILYLLLCLFVIGKNIARLPEVMELIFTNAFGLREAGVGTLMGTITIGVKRGLFSNEAGMGSAPNAAASACTSHPVKQGFIQAFGVFFDTILICSATAFLILFSGVDFTDINNSGIVLTQAALSTFFGDFGSLFLTICIFLLAFSSVLGNYFYAHNSLSFLSKKPAVHLFFKVSVVVAVFAGSVSSLPFVWSVADLLMTLLALINLYAIFRLQKVLVATLADYRKQKANDIDPVFKKENFTEYGKFDAW